MSLKREGIILILCAVVMCASVIYHAMPSLKIDSVPAEKTEQMEKIASKKKRRLQPSAAPFSLPGRRELEKEFSRVIDIMQNPEKYSRFGIYWPGNILLEGPPGTGKTYAVEQLAQHLGFPIYRIDASTIGSTYIYETAMRIDDIFRQAAENAPSIIIMDEMDSFVSSRRNFLTPDRVEEITEFLRHLQKTKEKRILVGRLPRLY